MSQRHRRIKAVSAACVVLLSAAGLAAYRYSANQKAIRESNRELIHKSLPYAVMKRSMFVGTKIEVLERDESSVRLKGTITAYKTYTESIDFQWQIPEGVNVVSGAIAGSVAGLGYLKTYEVEITIDHLSEEENQNIGLISSLDYQGSKVGSRATFNTHPENTEEGRNVGLFEKLSVQRDVDDSSDEDEGPHERSISSEKTRAPSHKKNKSVIH